MPDISNIVNANDLEWKTAHHSEHFSGWVKRLTPSMKREKGHIGVVIERLKPKSASCPFHYHVYEDEFCLILKGKAMLRYGDKIIEVQEGDAISFARDEQIAHQFYNYTDETVDILMVGENVHHDICYYPDSDKWLFSSIRKVGKIEEVDYWQDEPDPPIIKSQP